MASFDRNGFDFNLFVEIVHDRHTYWRYDHFEMSLPQLLSPLECHQTSSDSQIIDTDSHLSSHQSTVDSHSQQNAVQTGNASDESFGRLMSYLDFGQKPSSEPLIDHSIDLMALGDCRDLWQKATKSEVKRSKSLESKPIESKPIESKQQKSIKRNKRLYVNCVHPKPNQLRFPEKLWRIIDECNSDAIKWSLDGNSIVINYRKFKIEYLNDLKHFKTRNISSFVRQLNLYGFHKCGLKTKRKTNSPFSSFHSSANKNSFSPQLNQSGIHSDDQTNNQIHEFMCEFFKRDNKDLLKQIKRKYPNEENSDTKTSGNNATDKKSERKALRQLNGKREHNRTSENCRKRLFDQNLNSLNYTTDIDSQHKCIFNCYPFQPILPKSFTHI